MLVYAALFLILTSASFLVLSASYDRHLVLTRQYDRLRVVTEYSDALQPLFCSFQLLIILFFFRPFRRVFDLDHELPGGTKRSVIGNVSLGFLSGLIALLAVFPTFFLGSAYQPAPAVGFLFDNFDRSSGVGMLLLLIFVLPGLSEAFFRGVLLRLLLENLSSVSAVIISVLLFMLWWPTYSLIAGVVFGSVAGLLFYRTRSVLACVVANSFFTAGFIALQLWRL
ncbi:MAG: CPBP family intramembrane glutamic endopeptidase [Candidatus Acidiferrales bacterium]